MAIEHRNIPDAQRHEPKGASTAAAGTVLSANGIGGTEFVDPRTLDNTLTSVVLEAANYSDQVPVALDTAYQVTFGSPQSNTDITLAADGSITINTTGYYLAVLNVNFGRTTGAGEAYLLLRVTVNGTPTGFVQGAKLPDENQFAPIQLQMEGTFSAGTVFRIQILRDSVGIDNGGLYGVNPNTVGWDNIPSAWIRVKKRIGGQ